MTTDEGKYDAAMEAARAERTGPDLADSEKSLYDAADCADQAQIDGDTDWYRFAVGVAANDQRSAHLFA